MADIQQYLDKIAKAEAGEDVRWSIHDSIEKINQDVSTATNIANASKTAAENAAITAEQASAAANTAAGSVANATWLTNLFEIMPNRRAFIRHKNLGEFDDSWYALIKNGVFDDICVGDYWSSIISGDKIMIVDIDYYGERQSNAANESVLLTPSVDVIDIKGVISRWLKPSLLKSTLGYSDCAINDDDFVQQGIVEHFQNAGFDPNRHIISIRKATQYSRGSMQFITKKFWLPSVMQVTGSFLPATGASNIIYNQPYTDDWKQWALCKLDSDALFENVPGANHVLLREISAFNNSGDATNVYTCYIGGLNNSQITNATTKILASATIA